VGKAKKDKMTKVAWKVEGGELCPTDECTWEGRDAFKAQPGSMDPDTDELVGTELRLHEQSNIWIAEAISRASDGKFELKFTGKVDGDKIRPCPRKKEQHVDLSLPAGENVSWWRMSGYETLEEEDDDDEENGEEEEEEQEEEGEEEAE